VSIRHLSLFVFSFNALAQHTAIRGELETDDVTTPDYQVELGDCTGSGSSIRGWLLGGNRFEFDDVTPGCKTLRVLTGDRKTIVQEMQIFAGGSAAPVTIRIPRQSGASSPAGIISAERLRRPIPSKVARAMADANRLWQAGRVEEAAAKLRPMVGRYPDFWELQMNAGVVEMKLGNVETAAVHFLKGRELQPHSATLAIDAGFALLKLNRIEEAERAANDALAVEPQNKIAHLLLDRIRSVSLGAAGPR